MGGAAALAWLALYTQGNGAAVFPAAFVALGLAGRRRAALRWAALSLPPLAVYAPGTH